MFFFDNVVTQIDEINKLHCLKRNGKIYKGGMICLNEYISRIKRMWSGGKN